MRMICPWCKRKMPKGQCIIRVRNGECDHRQEDLGITGWLWCRCFHKKHRKRTGNRLIGEVSIHYELVCEKCGCEDSETYWNLYGGYWT